MDEFIVEPMELNHRERVWISKADGRQRPLGVAALEDKIVQYAVGTVLNQIWEEDFLGFSYGFRPRRSQHDALDALWVGIVRKKVNWILDLDIRSFFDRLSSIVGWSSLWSIGSEIGVWSA